MENVVQSETSVQENKINTPTDAQDISKNPVQVSATGEILQGGEANPYDEARTNATSPLPDSARLQMEAERKISTNVMSICLTSDGLVIKDEEREDTDELASRLSGVYCEGVQYYDLNGITYINNTGMAILIDLLKALLEMKVEVQFVNVHESIKKKIREMGLENIINYGD